jgi:hypothetical protein
MREFSSLQLLFDKIKKNILLSLLEIVEMIIVLFAFQFLFIKYVNDITGCVLLSLTTKIPG